MMVQTADFHVERDVLDELSLDEVARKRTQSSRPPLGQRARDSLRCSRAGLKQCIVGCVPVLSWLPRYSVRDNAMGDLISGISVGIMHLPQGMAYALLASLPPVFGLYSSFYPVLVYFLFGTSRHISIGTFAVISIMIGSVTERLAPDSDFLVVNGTNGSAVLDVAARDAHRVTVASAVTLLGGIFQVLLGVVRFGFVVTYLSEPLVRGYTTGAAAHVVISQLKYVFGIHPSRFTGPLSQVYLLVDICSLLPQSSGGTVVVSVVSLFVLILVKELNSCYSKRLPLPIPIELIVIVGATIISYYCSLNQQFHISVVGEIPSGLKAPSVPDVSLFSSVVGDAFAIAIVGYAINISLGKTFALKHGYKVDSNQELVALGLSNTVGGFFQCYSVTSSMSRSLIQESTGGKTQVAGVIAAVIVLITVLKLGALFEELPKAVLATIVFVNLKGMFKQFEDIPVLWKSNKVDLLVWLVTLVCTFLLNLDMGLAVSIAFALLTVIFRSQLPRYSILGQVPGTELYLDMDAYEEAREVPGITIFHSSTTVYYTNAELYLEALQDKSGIDIGKLLIQKKKREAKLKRQKNREEKRAKKEAKKQLRLQSGVSVQTEVRPEKKTPWGAPASPGTEHHHHGNGVALTPVHKSTAPNGQVNWAYHEDHAPRPDSDSSETDCHGDEETNQTSSTGRGEGLGEEAGTDTHTHTIVLDFSTASFVDTVTVKMLRNMFRDFGEIDVDVCLAGCQVCVVEQLDRAGFFSQSVLKTRLFPSVHDAVLHSLRRKSSDTHTYECALDIGCITKM